MHLKMRKHQAGKALQNNKTGLDNAKKKLAYDTSAYCTSVEEVPREIYVHIQLNYDYDTLIDDNQSVRSNKDKSVNCKPIIYDEDTMQSTDITKPNSLEQSSYDDAIYTHEDIEIYNITEYVIYNLPLPKYKRQVKHQQLYRQQK